MASPPPCRPPAGAIGRWSSGTNSGTKEPHADSIAPAQLADIRRAIVALDGGHPEQPVWIFGYGSLIWDGWESKSERRCLRAAAAELPGWRRVFNKKSVLNWGTRAAPCPTLNLEQAPAASCRGLAFEFANDARFLGEMLLYLRRREACEPCELPIRIDGVGAARALVYLYRGANLIAERLTAEQLAALAVGASGSDGLCVNYIKAVAEKLAALGIDDPAVVELWRAVKGIR